MTTLDFGVVDWLTQLETIDFDRLVNIACNARSMFDLDLLLSQSQAVHLSYGNERFL